MLFNINQPTLADAWSSAGTVRLPQFVAVLTAGKHVVDRLQRNFAPGGIWQQRQLDLTQPVRKAESWEIMALGLGGPSVVLVRKRPNGAYILEYRRLTCGISRLLPDLPYHYFCDYCATVLVPVTSPWHPTTQVEAARRRWLGEHGDELTAVFRPLQLNRQEYRVRCPGRTHPAILAKNGQLVLPYAELGVDCRCPDVLDKWRKGSAGLTGKLAQMRRQLERRRRKRSTSARRSNWHRLRPYP